MKGAKRKTAQSEKDGRHAWVEKCRRRRRKGWHGLKVMMMSMTYGKLKTQGMAIKKQCKMPKNESRKTEKRGGGGLK